MYSQNQQVYIALDGDKDGIVIQTRHAVYMCYYRYLGYKVIGPAIELPLEVPA